MKAPRAFEPEVDGVTVRRSLPLAKGALGQAGFEPVRLAAIDQDWAARRFRRAAIIQTLQRAPERTLSRAGRARAPVRTGEKHPDQPAVSDST